jgi:hypothetical protein
MSDLIDIREKLEDTRSTIARIYTSLAADPNDKGLALMLESLESRQTALESTFNRVANARHLEVCSYRLIRSDDEVMPIVTVGETLKTFQAWLTVVYDAIKSGTKRRSRPSADVVQQTTLDFGYTFAGSLGVVFTVPGERDLFDNSELNRSIDGMFSMLRAKEPNELVQFARAFGISSIRRMYEWASNHANYGISVHIKWRRVDTIRSEMMLQAPEATHLCELIDLTSETTDEEIVVVGKVVGLDTVARNFHMTFTDADEIKGQMAEDFTYDGETLEHTYRATILRSKIVRYATEEEELSHKLLHLEEVN